MYGRVALGTLCFAFAVSAAGCGTMQMSELLDDVAPGYGASASGAPIGLCKPAGEIMRSFAGARPGRGEVRLSTAMDVRSVNARIADAQTFVPADLRNDAVVQQLFRSISIAANQTDRQIRSLADAQLVGPTLLLDAPGQLNELDFQTFADKLRRNLFRATALSVVSEVPPGNGRAALDAKQFAQAFSAYFSAYYRGKYVDRFGTALPKPAISQTIGNTEIAGVVSVFLDFLMDYTLRTPIWKDKKGLYYPGGVAADAAPTASTVPGFIPVLDVIEDTHGCGITTLKAEAIQYVANTAASRASLMAGTVGGSFGGINVGLGVLGKLSIGDNQTLQVLAKTTLSKMFERVGEESAYRVLYWLSYDGGDTLAELLQKYLDAQNTRKSGS